MTHILFKAMSKAFNIVSSLTKEQITAYTKLKALMKLGLTQVMTPQQRDKCSQQIFCLEQHIQILQVSQLSNQQQNINPKTTENDQSSSHVEKNTIQFDQVLDLTNQKNTHALQEYILQQDKSPRPSLDTIQPFRPLIKQSIDANSSQKSEPEHKSFVKSHLVQKINTLFGTLFGSQQEKNPSDSKQKYKNSLNTITNQQDPQQRPLLLKSEHSVQSQAHRSHIRRAKQRNP